MAFEPNNAKPPCFKWNWTDGRSQMSQQQTRHPHTTSRNGPPKNNPSVLKWNTGQAGHDRATAGERQQRATVREIILESTNR